MDSHDDGRHRLLKADARAAFKRHDRKDVDRAVILIAVFYFTVSFWTALWAVCAWLDDKALQALYPKGGLLEFSGTGFTQDIIVGLATLFIYLIIPGIWTALMMIAGAKLSGAGEGALSQFKGGISNATKQGVNTAKNAVTRGRL